MEPAVHHKPIRYYELDLLRFLAALSVVLFHFTYRGFYADNLSSVEYTGLEKIFKYGYLGVELFFIISGYVVLQRLGGSINKYFLLAGMLVTVLLLAYLLHVLVERRYSNRFGQWLRALLART